MSVYKELGAKLKGFISAKTEEVDDKVEAIDKHERYVNTDLDYCFCKLDTLYTPVVGEYVPFQKVSGSFELINGRVVIKPGQCVEIKFALSLVNGTGTYSNIFFYIKDYTNDVNIVRLHPISTRQMLYSSCQVCQYVNDNDFDCEVGLYVQEVSSNDNLHNDMTTMMVTEINRQIVIDPVEHVNDSQGIEDTPVGHIIAHMGTVAPKHYLICDGTEYNIADYPYLAQHIEDNFGSISYFGGDGTTTFAVPDLRGEFLRGSGTAARATGSGATVGKHQDGTQILRFQTQNGNILAPYHETDTTTVSNADKNYPNDNIKQLGKAALSDAFTPTADFLHYTTRPTNTSVLYCIKYEPTYFMVTTKTTTQEEVDAVKEQNSLLQEQISALQEQNTLLNQEITQLSEILDNLNNTEV